MDPNITLNDMMTAVRNYENMKKASREYYARKKQQKIDAGTYRGRGRPRKDTTPPPVVQNGFVAVVSV
jgi:hypothetical protein